LISYVKGDLLKATEPVIVHGCNDRGVMGSGVAKVIRAKWPAAYRVYKWTYDEAGLELGDIISHYAMADDKRIVNAITQEGYGRDGRKYVSYDAVDLCFSQINSLCKRNDYDSIAIPKIGSDLGGGDWDIIIQIIKSKMTDADVKVYVL